MVQVPERCPDWRALLEKGGIGEAMGSEEVIALLGRANSRYYYWDKVRSQPLDVPVSKEVVWACLKMQREVQLKALPLIDMEGRPFRYWLPDPLPGWLHRIDRLIEEDRLTPSQEVRVLMEEAITSSQIEGAATTIRDARQMLLEGRAPRDQSERMIVNNYETMQMIKSFGDDGLSLPMLLEMQRTLTRGTLRQEQEGRLRKAGEDVRVENHQGELLFQPPPAESLEEAIESLCRFANEENGLHPVVKAIALHFYLAYLHPFVDGNGRTARALFYWYLVTHGYWYVEYLSISKIILQRPAQYGRAYLYTELDESDLTYFLHFHLRVLSDAIDDFGQLIDREEDLLHGAISKYPDLNERQSRLMIDLERHPSRVVSIKQHQNAHGVAYQTARTDLLELVERGYLKQIQKGRGFSFLLPN
jgi:Fic family protein